MTPTSISLAERLRVKPLEWYDVTTPREDGPREPTGDIEAATEIGPYSVVIDTDEDVADYPWCCWTPTDSLGHFASQDEAKAAAQADYEARIYSALIPVEPVPTPREAELEAALPGAFITCNSEAPKYYVTIKTQTLADAQAWHRAVLARARIGRGS